MTYPTAWRADRTARRLTSFQTLPPIRRSSGSPGGPRLPPIATFRELAKWKVAARIGARFIPYVGIGLLAVEVGWYYYQRQYSGNPGAWSGPAGWTYGGPCAGFGNPTFKQASFNGIEHCFGGTVGGDPLGNAIPDTDTSFHLGYRTGSKIADREWWFRAPGDFPGSVPARRTQPSPVVPSPIQPYRKFDPMDIPLEPAPQVVPDPIPRSFQSPYPGYGRPKFNVDPRTRVRRDFERRRRSWRSPTDGSKSGPRSRGQPPHQPNPRLPPHSPPAREVEVEPLRRKPRRRPSRHDLVKPKGRKNRERKARMKTSRAFQTVRILFEGAFEAIDVIRAIYLALPQNVRDFYPEVNLRTPVEMMRIIHRHYRLIRLDRMIDNLVWNEIEDFLIGRLGRQSAFAAQGLNLSTGIGFGSAKRLAGMKAWRRQNAQDAIKYVVDQVETFK